MYGASMNDPAAMVFPWIPPAKVEVALVDVAEKEGAESVLYAVTSPPKSELPITSKIFPVVVVAVPPMTITSAVSAG